ncbi:hypothetical protein C7B61_00185 [filamentous cyanobacterium CCP1]|nr:hypothetical protein C7B61_00185 [filamentous cyanobacterium CCP1]
MELREQSPWWSMQETGGRQSLHTLGTSKANEVGKPKVDGYYFSHSITARSFCGQYIRNHDECQHQDQALIVEQRRV